MLKKLKLPYGFQDIHQDECYNKSLIETRLSNLYKNYGYCRVETPTVEYYDTFHDVYQPDKLKKMFKLTDSDGSLLALRPDITLQICRLSSGLEPEYAQRLFYCENSFEYSDSYDTARTREFAQIGVELLGNSGLNGEIEIVSLAIESFLSAGLEQFTIELGNNRFFKSLMSESGMSKAETSALTELINKKDELGTEMFLQRKEAPKELYSTLLQLPSLFGGEHVFARAESMTTNRNAIDAVRHLKTLFEALKQKGYEKYISIDLGMLNGLDYYSGLVLKGYTESLGLCLLDGGRYDGICPSFGYDSGAVGFAIGTKRLLSALDKRGKLKKMPPCDIAYISDDSDRLLEKSFCDKLRADGKSVVKQFMTEERALTDYCNKYGIKNSFAIKGGKIVILLGDEL